MVEFKISDFFYPLDLLHTYFLLRRSEHWTPDRLREYQCRKLARLLIHAATHVPYYIALFSTLGIRPEDICPQNAFDILAQVPVLSKATLKSHADQFLAQDYLRYKPRPVSTSGTTGTPLTVYWDKASNVMEFCAIQRLWRWAGFTPGQPFLDLRSRVIDATESHFHQEGDVIYLYNWKVRGLELSSDLISTRNIYQYYRLLKRFKPGLIRGHPQAIEHLATLILEHNLSGWQPKAITTASETLYDFQRSQIAKAFHAPILDSYGLKEHNVFIAQCRSGSYHISPEYGICEILDDGGRTVAPGEEGWIVGTGLHNYAQPLLRYNTLDRAVVSAPRLCSCGRTLPTIQSIIGRIDDCIVTGDGNRYSGFSFAFFDRPGLVKARLVQLDWENVRIEVVAQDEFTTDVQSALLAALERKVAGKVKFHIQRVEEIIQETPGKFKFVTSLIQPNPK